MKAYQREIIICIIASLVTILAVWFFFGTVEDEKSVVQTDLYDVVAPSPNGLLVINRPNILTGIMLKHPKISEAFSTYLPDIYLSILQTTTIKPPILFSFHPQGVVMYSQTDGSLDAQIENDVLKPILGIYNPHKTIKDDIMFTYYPDAKNRFLGFYQYNDVFVASYSKKLLEEVATQQSKKKKILPREINKIRQFADKSAPINLYIPADILNLHININDSLQWRIYDKWLLTDIFTGEGNICYFGSQPYFAHLDTLYAPMADTLSKRIESYFPQLHITPEINHDENMIYYTGCSPME
ncbi:hypothetical protein [Parabacteroides bouchesdurhonensis]|uniref:hypothetical protein n=1 Tax=Parabacteroides bouchesdurhonensis TaxID=1936995 RepID=UPI000C814FF3|nr:hypothetical protein [Parabacteroides bouchesdurhonensis]RHJ90501.1 hypothetical protein DW095_12680 [Bacteroides sp. AM07-16]